MEMLCFFTFYTFGEPEQSVKSVRKHHFHRRPQESEFFLHFLHILGSRFELGRDFWETPEKKHVTLYEDH